jgi:hypothetical protein
MPGTFSLNIGQPTESSRKQTIFSVLQDLPNNTQKLISPKDVRDAFLSTWSNSSFRVTTPGVLSTSEYIGIDSGDPSNRDIKNKIFIGKRSYGNLDIMTNTLLNSDTDIFFFNTKEDTATQSSTKLSILAGTNSALYSTAPYIESVVNSSNTGFDLNIKNPSFFDGPINVTSLSGRVSINGIAFPTLSETSASASNGLILRYFGTYPNGYLQWELPTVSVSSIGVTGLPTNIYGSTVSVNGYPIEFIENNIVPITLGGVTQGASFPATSFYNGSSYQNWPIVEVIRNILYPYIEPDLTLNIDINNSGSIYAEVGTTPSITITYSVTHYARQSSENISSFIISSNTSVIEGTTYSGSPTLSFGGIPGSYFHGTASAATYSSVTGTTVSFYSFASNYSSVTLAGFPLYFSFSATASMRFVSPVVGGFISGNTLNFDLQTSGNTNTRESVAALVYGQTVSVNKAILPYPGVSQSIFVSATGIGYLYFAVPGVTEYNLGILSQIKDPNGYIVHDYQSYSYSAFTFSNNAILPISPFDYYSSYRVYKTYATCSYYGGGSFELIFT